VEPSVAIDDSSTAAPSAAPVEAPERESEVRPMVTYVVAGIAFVTLSVLALVVAWRKRSSYKPITEEERLDPRSLTRGIRSEVQDRGEDVARHLFRGIWILPSGNRVVVSGNVAAWANGMVYNISFPGPQTAHLVQKGKVFVGKLAGEEVHWDDGDVWKKETEGRFFEGTWLLQSGNRVNISGNAASWPDGTVYTVAFPAPQRVQLAQKGKLYIGKLRGRELRWDDGDIWKKVVGE